MPNQYDKILKENLEAVLQPLIRRVLQIEPVSMKPIKEELQVTWERKPDLLKKVTDKSGLVFLLHIEFQTSDDMLMHYRMLEYRAILMRKYRLAVRQLVLYLGEGSSVMPREIQEEGLHFSYTLSSIQHYDASDLLMSEVPEEILLAILCNFGKDRPEEIIKKLLQRLQQLVKSPRILQRYIRQLSVLSQLRNLREVTVQQIKVMEFPYDIQKDFLYREGKAEGREEGKAEGREEGKAEGREEGKAESKKQIITRMLLSGHLTIAQIASFTGESEAFVIDVKKNIKRNK